MAATDEKDLPTPQSKTNTDARIHGPDGHAGRAQHSKAPTGKRPPALGDNDTAQTAGLGWRRTPGGLKAADRLRRSAEFIRIQRIGARAQTTHFVLYASKLPESERSRLGLTVSRRIGGAVVRNRVKRRVRECYRLMLRSLLPVGTAVVVIARAGAGALEWRALGAELETAARALGRKLKD